MSDMNQAPDKRFLGVVLVFGIASVCASIYWLNAGSITLHSRQPSPGHVARSMGQVAAGHMLFYPLCATWGVIGACMVAFSSLGYLQDDLRLYKLCAYCCLALILLGLATVLTAKLARGP